MKKLYSLIKACMTSDMNIFKIKANANNKNSKRLIIFVTIMIMFAMGSYAVSLYEALAPIQEQQIGLSIFVLFTSFMTLIQGIYKSGSLIFNCKDDQLLLSLPIERRTVLFIRIFKFYVFELMFNSLFLIPAIVAYIPYAESLSYTYFITSILMILLLPIIPIIISSIIGVISTSLSSRFKYKNIVTTIFSMAFLLVVLYFSFNSENAMEYIVQNSSSVNEMISKIYYPAGLFARLAVNFNLLDLLLFVLINIVLFTIAILVLGKFYFKINSRIKNVIPSKKVNISKLKIKANSYKKSLVRKELNTFFNTPVLIINSGFALLLYVIATILITIKYDSFISSIMTNEEYSSIVNIIDNHSILILLILIVTAFMTSMTNAMISLEGKNINILKSLPISTKDILMSKVNAAVVLTTPLLFIGNIILFIKFKIKIIEIILLLILSILIPLISHLIGIIINVKYPKLDASSPTEAVKQSTSSMLSVLLGMILLVVSTSVVITFSSNVNSTTLLLFTTLFFIVINILLYLYLTNKSVKEFNKLSI